MQNTIVVGAGLAGLTTATYLARAGHHVTLLDKAKEPGGRAITDKKDGFALNRGIHALYSGGAASEVLSELRIDYKFGIPRNVWVRDQRGLHRFPADAMSLLQTSLLTAGEKFELVGLLTKVTMLDPLRSNTQTVDEWLDTNSHSPRIRALLASIARAYLYSAALDVASADTFLARLQQTVKHPVHYVEGGWQSIVDALRQAAQEAGVQIRTSANVAKLTFCNGEVDGVQFRDGSELYAKNVVLALPLADAQNLIDASPLQERFGQIFGHTLPVPVAALDLALSGLPDPRHPVIFDMEHPVFATAQSVFTSLAPEGGAVVHAFKQLDPRKPTDPQQDRADLERFLDTVQPGWRELVVEQRFLPHIAAAGTLPLATHGGLDGRALHHLDAAPNLYFAGDWVGARGWLIDASLDSARSVARSILASSRVEQPVLAHAA